MAGRDLRRPFQPYDPASLSVLKITGRPPSAQHEIFTPSRKADGNSPPRQIVWTFLAMSAQAELQNPSGIVHGSPMKNSCPSRKTSQVPKPGFENNWAISLL